MEDLGLLADLVAVADESEDEDAPADVLSRNDKVFYAAAQRMSGLQVVLDSSIVDGGTRAAILRSAESFGLLHAHKIESESLRRRWESTAGEKWLMNHSHTSIHAAIEELRSEGFEHFYAVAALDTGGDASDDDDVDVEASQQAQGVHPGVVHIGSIDFSRRIAVIFCEGCVRDEIHAEGVATLRLGLSDETLPLSILAAITLHFGRTARSRAASAELNAWGGDLAEEAVHELHADYLKRGRGFRRGRRIQATEPREVVQDTA